MVLVVGAANGVLASGLPSRAAADDQGCGRWRITSASSFCDAADGEVTAEELRLSQVTDISKLKGQVFQTLLNAKLLAVNTSYVIYAFKEGSLRVINQSARDHFRLTNSTKARIMDLALPPSAEAKGDNILLCLDEEGNLSIFQLDVQPGATGAERTRMFEMALRDMDMPQRVLLHKDPRFFVTAHAANMRLWSLPRILQEMPNRGLLHPSPAQLQHCCSNVLLPKGSSQIRDVAISADGSCLVAITADSLFVWRISADASTGATGLQLIQHLAMAEDFTEGLHMLRFVGTQFQAMVAASASGCDLLVYSFDPASPAPVGQLLQSVQLAPPGSTATACLEVDRTESKTLAVSFANRRCFLLLPLAMGWSTSSRIAFPYVQRFGAEAPGSKHTLMTAMSRQNKKTLFLYRAMSTSGEDGKWDIVVHQPSEESIRPEEPVPSGSSSSEAKAGEGETVDTSPQVHGHGVEAEEAMGDVLGDEPDNFEASGSTRRHEDVDWRFVKQIAASFVRGLEKRRGELAEKIIAEVVTVTKSRGTKNGAGESEVLDQVLAKVREAREAQAASENNLHTAARQAADAWTETSAASMSSLMSKEFGKISDGVAVNLAQQLSQSRKFCEALARGVQKSGAAATKQALEALRPPKQIQETVGSALGEALQEALTPVFKSELRSHFEQELGPLIGQRVSEMLSVFRERMTECLEDIATEHEQAAQRLGRDLAPLVAEELQQVKHLMQSSGSSASISEAQLDELTRAVEVEVIHPLHARVKQLTVQVQALRAEAEELQSRAGEGSADSSEAEAAQARELQRLFHDRAEDAFVRALQKQKQARHQDFLEQLCSLVPQPDAWLTEDPSGSTLSTEVKMNLMHALTHQLSSKSLDESVFQRKVEWIEELWLALDLGDKAVDKLARGLCAQLIEALEHAAEGPGREQALRKLKRTLQHASKMMSRE
ncbi:unnamed protein product [Effrenium voratum]|nr:unnamed protein product [Effrenium voratum]